MTEWMDDRHCSGATVLRGVEGAKLTTFGSGGRVEYLLKPSNAEGVASAVSLLAEKGISYRLIGGGSNLLLPDEGYHGALISLSRLSGVGVAKTLVTADAGVRMPRLAHLTAERSLSGLEFACGIPGTVGGAVCANAGAFGQMISDVLVAVLLLNRQGETELIPAERLEMRYHRCVIPSGSIVLSAIFDLREGDRRAIEDRMRLMTERRRRSQPCERSAGSVFRRVGDTPAALYIERTGLKGIVKGGAQLSPLHCNFIVNRGGATTADYFAVAECVRERVLEESGVLLEYEVERICSPRKN